jgi:hypothetical protein
MDIVDININNDNKAQLHIPLVKRDNIISVVGDEGIRVVANTLPPHRPISIHPLTIV